MAQKPVPTVLKKEGKRNVVYRDVDGKTYVGIITLRNSATNVNLQLRVGGLKVVKSNVPQATAPKQTNVFFAITGH